MHASNVGTGGSNSAEVQVSEVMSSHHYPPHFSDEPLDDVTQAKMRAKHVRAMLDSMPDDELAADDEDDGLDHEGDIDDMIRQEEDRDSR